MSLFDEMRARATGEYLTGVEIDGKRIEAMRQDNRKTPSYILRISDLTEQELLDSVEAIFGEGSSAPATEDATAPDEDPDFGALDDATPPEPAEAPAEEPPPEPAEEEELVEEPPPEPPEEEEGGVSEKALAAAKNLKGVAMILHDFDPEANDLVLYEYMKQVQASGAAPVLKPKTRDTSIKKAIDQVLGN